MKTRAITQADRAAALHRLEQSIQRVNLTESQIEAIQKATGQDRGVRYSAVVR